MQNSNHAFLQLQKKHFFDNYIKDIGEKFLEYPESIFLTFSYAAEQAIKKKKGKNKDNLIKFIDFINYLKCQNFGLIEFFLRSSSPVFLINIDFMIA